MNAVVTILIILLNLLQWAILIRVLLSWLPMAGIRVDPYNPVVKILYDITDPILVPLRKFTTIGMIDLSPVVAFIIVGVLIGLLSGS